mgnify:CR=1 FL=1
MVYLDKVQKKTYKGGINLKGYFSTVENFLETDTKEVVYQLKNLYPDAMSGQVRSWYNFVNDLKNTESFRNLTNDSVVAIEYDLPTEGMGIDCILAGYDVNHQKVAVLIEAKQWGDDYIEEHKFDTYRAENALLHPQVQISKHQLCFNDYLDIGKDYKTTPCVFVKNATENGLCSLIKKNPSGSTKQIPLYNSLDKLIREKASNIVSGSSDIIMDFITAEHCPVIGIDDAMRDLTKKNAVFVLPENQEPVYDEIMDSISKGKRVIRINGDAGAGKTAVLLNLYAELRNREDEKVFPIFVPGAQNTAYYRNKYPEMAFCFTYSYSVSKMIAQNKGKKIIVLMDEAQHNEPGVITEIINMGAILVICYDAKQTLSTENSISELRALENKNFFKALEIKGSVRFNGSLVAEGNIRKFLCGRTDFKHDDKFEFMTFRKIDDFQNKMYRIIQENPNDRVAILGLMCQDAQDYTYPKHPKSKLITKWDKDGDKRAETCYIEYVDRKTYLNENKGLLRVGTWWAPGLDFDYVGIIIGRDGKITTNGFEGVPEQSKHYKMIIDIAKYMNFPKELFDGRNYIVVRKVMEYVKKQENETIRTEFQNLFTAYLRHMYYITMTRGKKGCYVLFSDK